MAIAKSPLLYRCYLLITMLYLAFIGVASFYLTRSIPDASSVLEVLFATTLKSLKPSFHNLRDIATNVVLYLPLGVLVCATGSLQRSMRPVGWVLFFGLGVSLFVEIVQAFIGRYSDVMDIISNASGYALGYLVAWWAIYRIGLQPSILLGHGEYDQTQRSNTLLGLRFAYVAIALIVSLLPLNLSVSLSELMAQLSAVGSSGVPKLILDPLYHFRADSQSLHLLVLRLLTVIPFAVITTLLEARRSDYGVARVARQCLLFSATLEFCKIFVLGAYSDIFVVLAAPLTGFAIAWAMSSHDSHARHAHPGTYWSLAVIAYALLLMMVSWTPFEFELTGRVVLDKLLESNLIPFRLHFSARSMASAIDIVKESGLYIPLGILIFQWLAASSNFSRPTIAGLVVLFGFAFSMAMELSQLLVVGRYVDITDPLLAASGCLIGYLLAPLAIGLAHTGINRASAKR